MKVFDLTTTQHYGDKYAGKVLVWGSEAAKIRSDSSITDISWKVGLGKPTFYTKAALLKALDDRAGILIPYKKSYFIVIKESDLAQSATSNQNATSVPSTTRKFLGKLFGTLKGKQ